MRASAWHLAALLAAGCDAGPTALDVTVTFSGAAQPARLAVTLRVDRAPLRMDVSVVAPDGRPLHSGGNFVVLLPDTLDGQKVTVQITAPGTALAGAGTVVAVRGRKVDLVIALDGARDGGVDLGGADLAGDGGRCEPGGWCIENVQTACEAGQLRTRACGFGCSGTTCLLPDGCGSPGDIRGPGTYRDSSLGFGNSARGSCAPTSGADAVTRITLKDWSTVTFDTMGSAFDTVLFTRTECANAMSELALAGPCQGALTTAVGTTCNDDSPTLMGGASRLVVCGLPPGTYYTWIDSKSDGGTYQLNVTVTPVSLNACDDAGRLLAGSTLEATTSGHANNYSSSGKASCGLDAGSTSPDAVFYFVLTATKDVTISTKGTTFRHSLYVRSDACGGTDLACDIAINPPAMLTLKKLTPGIYFVFVDGVAGDRGAIAITMTEK
ncbi:MAG: hypothetical protein EXR72_08130 [Myxococcales bacterium]|nr:hypothetical protein [Myxococcales bacterium]